VTEEDFQETERSPPPNISFTRANRRGLNTSTSGLKATSSKGGQKLKNKNKKPWATERSPLRVQNAMEG